jgi:hypothetical protein
MQLGRIGLRVLRIHAQEHLPGAHVLTLSHQNLLDDAGIGGLDQLQIGLGHEPALSAHHDVQVSERCPRQRQSQENRDRVEHGSGHARGRALLQCEQSGRKIQRCLR